jgi:hypothetical protein
MPVEADSRDFLISYTHDDCEWAEWVAWQLEEASYNVLIQAWDIVPGTNRINWMDQGTSSVSRTIVILSEHYLSSAYGKAEWQAAWRRDPLGEQRGLLVFRVAECDHPGLLGSVTGVDLFGLSEQDARELLLRSVEQAIKGRAKPDRSPSFPRAVPSQPTFPPASRARRICMAVEIDQASSEERYAARPRLSELLVQAWTRADIPPERIDVVDRDGGILAALPPELDEEAAVPQLILSLCERVRALNHHPGHRQRTRLRVALAQGVVQPTGKTLVGRGVDLASTLVSSSPVRSALGSLDSYQVAFIIASDIYREVLESGRPGLPPADFYRVHVSDQQRTRSDAWIYAPYRERSTASKAWSEAAWTSLGIAGSLGMSVSDYAADVVDLFESLEPTELGESQPEADTSVVDSDELSDAIDVTDVSDVTDDDAFDDLDYSYGDGY